MIDRKLNILMLLLGSLGGALGWLAGQTLISRLEMPRPVAVALFMGVVGTCIVLFCVLAETLFPIVNGMNWKRHYAGITWKYLFPAILLPMLILGGVMQLIYQMDFSPKIHKDIYMLIDRSGSMEWNDPENERLAAVERLIAKFDVNDMVEIITFDHEAEVVQELTKTGTASDRSKIAEQLLTIEPRGGTDFNVVLSLTHERVRQNQAKNREPFIIFLSDGASELDDDVLRLFTNDRIVVNTVGLLVEEKDGEPVLSHIAAQTGGQYVLAENTDRLDLAFTQIYQQDERFILSPKNRSGIDITQWILFTLAGLIIGLVTGFIFDNRYIVIPLAVGGFVCGLLAGGLLCWPIPLLLPCILLGCLFTLFTLFSKIPPPASSDAPAVDAGVSDFLRTAHQQTKTHGRFS